MKEQTQHTPGPWMITNARPSPDVPNTNADIVSDVGWPIALVYSGTNPKKPRDCANACLIAAAPDLLAALKAAEGYLMPYADASATNSPDKKVFAIVTAAIAKAEGWPP